MDFSEKISIILKTNKLKLATKEELAEFCGFHRDTIRKAIDRGSELKDRYLRTFQDKLSINPDWWDTGKGDIYLENGTPMPKAIQNNGKHENTADELIRHLVQGDSDYVLINKELILERYRLYSIEQIEGIKEEAALKHKEILQELEDRKNQIHGLYKIISELTSKLPPGEPAHMQKAK